MSGAAARTGEKKEKRIRKVIRRREKMGVLKRNVKSLTRSEKCIGI